MADPDRGNSTRHPSLDDRFDPAITVSPYDEDWPRKFEREAAAIHSELGGVALWVDHVGSTAVPRLNAKPIVDIQFAVEDVRDLGAFVPGLSASAICLHLILTRLTLTFSESPRSVPATSTSTFARGAARTRLGTWPCATASAPMTRKSAIRRPKRELAARTPSDRLAYLEAKAPYMSDLERRAIAWYVHRSV